MQRPLLSTDCEQEIGAAEHDWCSSGGLECSFTIYSESSPSLFSGRLLVMQKDSTERAHTLQLMLNTDYEEVNLFIYQKG